jgi:hypothetical protein
VRGNSAGEGAVQSVVSHQVSQPVGGRNVIGGDNLDGVAFGRDSQQGTPDAAEAVNGEG